MLNRLKRFITVSALSNTVMIFVIILILISANLGSGFSSAVDIFHEGEMLGNYWHMQDYYRGKSNFPLVIHGAMDYWPSLFAGLIFGEDKIIYGTRLIVVVTTTISWGIFVFTGISILSRNSKNNLLILVFVAIFCLTLPIFSLNVMAIEESPVGLRDPFLLLQMLLLIHYYISKESKVFFLAAMFALLPITLYWSYDRGVAAVLACMSLLMYLIYSKQYREFFASIFALVISVTLLEITNIAGSLVENLSNVLYWSGASGEVWGTKFNPNLQSIGALLKSFAIWLPLIFVGTVFGLAYISNKIDKNTVPVGIILFVFVIELILIKSAYNRPNLHRGLMSVWPSILLFLWLISSQINLRSEIIVRGKLANGLQANLIGLSFVTIFCAVLYFSIPFGKISSFVKLTKSPPNDSIIAGGSLTQVADILRGADCSLNMVNQGVITLLSKTSHCTKFPYLVYASKESETELIEKIGKLKINSIVIESHDWSTNIDERDMKSRLPDLHNFLSDTFPKRTSVNNYLILQR